MGIMNYIYGSPSQTNTNTENEIKTSFMPKINREPVNKRFNNKLSSNLTKYLFDFFPYKDLYEMGKINVYFMNNIIDYFQENEQWPDKVRKLKIKYNFSIHKSEVDESLKEAKNKKRRYKFPGEDGKEVNYYQYDIDGNKYLSIARTFTWAHKNNDSYWREEKVIGSYEKDSKVPYLITVCWINTNFSFFHVIPNNYKLYINESFVRMKRFKEKVTLKVIINDDIIIYNEKFPSQKVFDYNNCEREEPKLNEDFICYIKKEDFNEAKKDENGDCLVKIQFQNIDDFWKGGWYIDGGCLREITQKQLDDEIAILEKLKEEKERNRYFGKEEDEK